MTGVKNRSVPAKCLSDISLTETSFIHGSLNVPGLAGLLCFYALVFAVGIFASWRSRRRRVDSRTNDVMLAGRNMNEVIGVFTLAATWVGGDFLNGTAEFIINPSYRLVWCQAPFLFSSALIVNGVFFAKKMWNAGYVTMLDPFEVKFGQVQTAFLYIATLVAEVSFAALAFAVLGASLNVIVGISFLWAVILSALVALVYTILGGLSSVAYTDVVQLVGIMFGLVLTIPFALKHPAVTSITVTARGENSWLGTLPEGPWIGCYVDTCLMLFFGAIPWQIYFQRALSQSTAHKAMTLSIAAAFVALVFSAPCVIIGAIAASTDWNMTGYREIGEIPMPACDYPLALPLVMRFLTPTAVGVVGLGAVSAAVMSSSDSCILSCSSLFAYNVYKPLRNSVSAKFCRGSKAGDREVVWVLRGAMLAVAAMTTIIAITVKSIVALVMLCVDIPYCIMLPQLVCVLYLPWANAYGSFLGFFVGLFFRFSGGEAFLGIPALIRYPWYNEEHSLNLFPFKTMTTIISFLCIIAGSWVAQTLAKRYDFFMRLDRHLFESFQQVYKDDQKKSVDMQVDYSYVVSGTEHGNTEFIDEKQEARLSDSFAVRDGSL